MARFSYKLGFIASKAGDSLCIDLNRMEIIYFSFIVYLALGRMYLHFYFTLLSNTKWLVQHFNKSHVSFQSCLVSCAFHSCNPCDYVLLGGSLWCAF